MIGKRFCSLTNREQNELVRMLVKNIYKEQCETDPFTSIPTDSIEKAPRQNTSKQTVMWGATSVSLQVKQDKVSKCGSSAESRERNPYCHVSRSQAVTSHRSQCTVQPLHPVAGRCRWLLLWSRIGVSKTVDFLLCIKYMERPVCVRLAEGIHKSRSWMTKSSFVIKKAFIRSNKFCLVKSVLRLWELMASHRSEGRN